MNGKTRGSRAPQRAAVLPIVAAVAVLSAGCDVVHVHFGSSGASASPGSATFQPTLAFVQCMHSHGLKTFPNPGPGKSVTLQLTGNSPIVRGYDACKHLLPGTSATVPATAGPPGAVPADCLALRSPCFRPQQFRTAYGIQPLLDRGITGRGQTVVLLEFPSSTTGAPAHTDVRQDLARFDSVFGLPAARLQVVNTLAHAASPWLAAGPVGTEEVMDTEIVHALAPDAAIREVLIPSSDTASPDTVAAALAAAMRLGLAQHPAVMSLSIGAGEQCFTPAVTAQIDSVLQTAQRDRVTVVVGTGDSGAATTACPGPGAGSTQVKGVDFPASDPFVLAAGGTSLQASRTTGAYIGETAWNVPPAAGGPAASGGGFSRLFSRPAYQDGIAGIGAARGLPDVSSDGDTHAGMALDFSEGGKDHFIGAGGGSAAPPLWAAVIALADQYAGRDLGFVNPALYQIARSA
ncbi:MAG TPA: S53 family peptidase, partial [Streptosporangiaceae bacterium]|nr:S53 family peptidase [Streptosporangiaceae bacterium]